MDVRGTVGGVCLILVIYHTVDGLHSGRIKIHKKIKSHFLFQNACVVFISVWKCNTIIVLVIDKEIVRFP